MSTDENGYVIYTDGEQRILVAYCGTATELVLPNDITSIYRKTFYKRNDLISITIPDNVISIGNYALAYCSSLTSVTIGNRVTSIGDGAFFYCSNLKSITIPDSVTSIGVSVFKYCSGLTKINFKGTKAEWKNISKYTDWKDNTGEFIVYCTDGTIEKSNA